MKFEGFQVKNFRNVIDSGWIPANQITAFVGQNEAGKSNLFEALYCLNPIIEGATYKLDEDWPVDDWENKNSANGQLACMAQFSFSSEDIKELSDEALGEPEAGENESHPPQVELPSSAYVLVYKCYGDSTQFKIHGFPDGALDEERAIEWIKSKLPKFVYVRDYELSGAQVELDQLQSRLNAVGQQRHMLSNEDQTILIVLDLAQIKLDDFLQKGQSSEGRTVRSFDKRSASKFLTKQFAALWRQKEVEFNIEIDGPTLNIFAEDKAIGMPVRLHRRSTGFRWYVSFAWKFTHATNGAFKDCVLLLEEPGVHLHYDGQRDLLNVFERLAEHNTILYTTHLASMVDLANPERVRIIETRDDHLAVTKGIVSTQRAPMAVIEQCLGLTGDLSGLLGNRQVLIVEGGDDAAILHKLSGLLRVNGKVGLSDRIYLWPAHGASKTPMYAGFAVGQSWDAGVLLDSDEAGLKAKDKIDELYVSKLADGLKVSFRVIMLGKAAGTKKTDFAIEDLFSDEFYLECVNAAFGLAIKMDDLPDDGSDMVTKRVEKVLKDRYDFSGLDKRRVVDQMWKQFDNWSKVAELPNGTPERAEKVFKTINRAFDNHGLD